MVGLCRKYGWVGNYIRLGIGLVGLEIWLDWRFSWAGDMLDRRFGEAVNLFGLGWAGDWVTLEIYLGWKFGWVGLAGGLVRLDWRFH